MWLDAEAEIFQRWAALGRYSVCCSRHTSDWDVHLSLHTRTIFNVFDVFCWDFADSLKLLWHNSIDLSWSISYSLQEVSAPCFKASRTFVLCQTFDGWLKHLTASAQEVTRMKTSGGWIPKTKFASVSKGRAVCGVSGIKLFIAHHTSLNLNGPGRLNHCHIKSDVPRSSSKRSMTHYQRRWSPGLFYMAQGIHGNPYLDHVNDIILQHWWTSHDLIEFLFESHGLRRRWTQAASVSLCRIKTTTCPVLSTTNASETRGEVKKSCRFTGLPLLFLAFLELCTLRLEENVLARPAACLCHLMWAAITGCLLASRCPVCPVCHEVSTFRLRAWEAGWLARLQVGPLPFQCILTL